MDDLQRYIERLITFILNTQCLTSDAKITNSPYTICDKMTPLPSLSVPVQVPLCDAPEVRSGPHTHNTLTDRVVVAMVISPGFSLSEVGEVGSSGEASMDTF